MIIIDISDEASDRIISQIEIEDGDSWYDIRKNLVKRFPKWGSYRRDRFAGKIVDRVIEVQEFEKGIITKSYIKMAVDQAIGIAGQKGARYKTIKTINGRYLGREGNIKITTRIGTKVYAKNLRTGRKGRIK